MSLAHAAISEGTRAHEDILSNEIRDPNVAYERPLLAHIHLKSSAEEPALQERSLSQQMSALVNEDPNQQQKPFPYEQINNQTNEFSALQVRRRAHRLHNYC